MSFQDDLARLLQARCTMIVLVTHEESRALEEIREMCQNTKRPLITWDIGDGFQPPVGKGAGMEPMQQGDQAARRAEQPPQRPEQALDQIDSMDTQALFVLKDFDEVWTNPMVRRKLRNISQRLKRVQRKSILITTTSSKVPEQLRDEAYVMEFPLPQIEELSAVLDRISRVKGAKVDLTALGKEKLLRAALGLSASQAERCFSRALVSTGVLDERHIEAVSEEKRQVIRESEALEFFPVSDTSEDVGGLEVLKEWLRVRERAFSDEARQYKLPAPKGVALLGIPGTGKSLTAKVIGSMWRMPLLRLDTGCLFGGLLGESEERTRRALHVAETIAPCVLWIDEIEKAFAQGDHDGGTSRRVFGSILTWMQEKKKPCFVVATANDVSRLPPELLRRGRFDEIFFLDLPTLAERREILAVHLRRRGRLARDFDLEALAQAADGFVGAEIEQAIVDGMYFGFDGGREFNTADVLKALKKEIPMSVAQAEVVQGLRGMLLEGRAQSASFREKSQAQQAFVELNLELSAVK